MNIRGAVRTKGTHTYFGKSFCGNSRLHFRNMCHLCLQVTGLPLRLLCLFLLIAQDAHLSRLQNLSWKLEMTKLFLHRHRERHRELFILRTGPQPYASFNKFLSFS